MALKTKFGREFMGEFWIKFIPFYKGKVVNFGPDAPLHQGQLRSVVGNSPIMGGDPTIGGNPTTGWYSTQHLVGILTIFTIDAI